MVGVINVRLEEEEDVLGEFRLPGDVIPEWAPKHNFPHTVIIIVFILFF